MKKRILSLALIVAMVVAMIPAVLVNAFAAAYTGHGDGYDVYYSETDPVLDGQMDAMYENSEKIYSTYNSGSAKFEAYFVFTANGMYACANIKDSTVDVAKETANNVNTGDYAQIYWQLSNTVDGSTQYSSGYDYADVGRTAYYQMQIKYTLTEDGYIMETYSPWSYLLKDRITNGFSLETATVKIGYQVNDYGIGDDTHKYICYDNILCQSYWSGDYCNGASAPVKSMIKTNVIKTPKTDGIKYTSFVTNETITLDGVRDDIYLGSQKITSGYVAEGTEGVTTGFETYIVARENGFYIFASIYDDTLDKADAVANGLRAQDGDKFQIYLQLGNNVWTRWGYIDFDYVDGGRHLVTAQTLGYSVDEIQQKAVIWEDQKGWDIEIFLPHTISADDRFKSDINANWTDLLMKVNFQALNETCLTWNASGVCQTRNRYGLSYDISAAQNAWNGPTAGGCYFVPVDFSVNPVSMPGTGKLTYAPSISIDGEKDAAYGDDSLAFVLDKSRSSNFTSENGNAYAKAWVAVSDTKINLYALVNDTTLSSSPSDAIVLYTYFPLTNTGTFFGGGYARSGHIETTSRWGANEFNSTNGNGDSNIGETQSAKSLGDGWYAIEMAMNLPYAERAAIARGETIEIGIGIQHRDRDTSNIEKAYNRSGYESYWNDKTYTKNSLPRFEVSKASTSASFTAVTTSTITGASVALGDSITVNYYANVPATAENVSMKFTMNGKVTFVQGVAESATSYKFPFKGIAPQCMSDNIKAELYIGGTKFAAKDGYSVLQNVNNVKNASNKTLVEALLHYGAAAQKYANYKTGALVNAGLADPTYANTLANNQKNIGTSTISGAKFSAAGVYHANINKIYAKVTVNNINLVDKLTVTVNGVEAKLEKYSDGVYIVYSEDISVKDFDKVYTFVLTGESGSQTITYSVNAYASVKWNDDNANTQALARAMYAYGVAAESYNG